MRRVGDNHADMKAEVKMRCLGLLGGMSWESTAIYYRLLNEGVRSRLGGLHSAPLLLWSTDFAHIADQQAADEWGALSQQLSEAGRRLVCAGAEALLICTNTMHRLHADIERASGVPVIHIADATAEALRKTGCQRPALLATRFTMESDFYTGRLRDASGIEAMIPDEAARVQIHRIIYDELCRGVVREESRILYRDAIETMRVRGADSVILGCTEITMLIGATDSELPLFDTTAIHAEAGVTWIVGSE
jgi:aspartate racemase